MIKRIISILATRRIIYHANRNGSKIDWRTGIDQKTVFGGVNVTNRGSACPGTFLGYASYIGTNTKLRNTFIGKYTSIAEDVSIVFGNHPSRNFVSTHNAFCFADGYSVCYTDRDHCFSEEQIRPYADTEKKYYCIIGNDVWIGKGAKIKCGIKIGDGAIVGAYSLVTKDVESYTIVGGVPAREIRKRFDEEDIKWLQNLQWWNKGEEWCSQYGKYFYDIKVLKENVMASMEEL